MYAAMTAVVISVISATPPIIPPDSTATALSESGGSTAWEFVTQELEYTPPYNYSKGSYTLQSLNMHSVNSHGSLSMHGVMVHYSYILWWSQ